MTESVTLGYWNIRGLAEKVRLVLEYLQIPYNQNFFTPETQNEWFSNVKFEHLKKNPAANLPYLIDGDKLICESDAIIVYLCHKADRKDLLGEGIYEQTQIATVMGVFKDLYKTFLDFIYGQKSYEQFKPQAINSLKPGLDKLKGLLGDKQWFTGKLSYCDIILGDFFQVLSLFNQNFSTEYPTLKALQERMWNLDGISSYLKSDKFKERPINYYPYAKWY